MRPVSFLDRFFYLQHGSYFNREKINRNQLTVRMVYWFQRRNFLYLVSITSPKRLDGISWNVYGNLVWYCSCAPSILIRLIFAFSHSITWTKQLTQKGSTRLASVTPPKRLECAFHESLVRYCLFLNDFMDFHWTFMET